MAQGEPRRVQRLAAERAQRRGPGGGQVRGQLQAAAVDGIADHGMPEVRHVHPYLVGASGVETDPEQGVVRQAPGHAVMGHGGAAAGDHRHAGARPGVPAHGCVHGAAGDDAPAHQGVVVARHAAGPQLGHQIGVRAQGLGDHQQAGGVLVEAVHDAGPGQGAQFRAMAQQAVEQGAVAIARTRMHHQPGGLVEHQQFAVLVHQRQRNFLLGPVAGRFQVCVEAEPFAAGNAVSRAPRDAIHPQIPAPDPVLEARAGKLPEQCRRRLIEPPPLQFGRHPRLTLQPLARRHAVCCPLFDCG
jgi:hypothetical protein